MKKYITIFVLGIASAGLSAAQSSETHMPVTLGLKVGIPVTDMFSAANTSQFNVTNPGSAFTSAVPRYEFGVSGEFHLPYHLRLEVDGLYKRGGFNSSSPFPGGGGVAYYPTSFNQWEIPALIKYNFSMGHYRPFIDFGSSLRHISTITQTTFAPIGPSPTRTDNTAALHNRNSFGGVAGIGITFKKGPFELTPEARYTRWANQSFMANGLRTNLDQGDVLLGISF